MLVLDSGVLYMKHPIGLPTENQHLYHAHNNFIQLLGEVGLLGLLGVLIFMDLLSLIILWFGLRIEILIVFVL